MQEKAKILNVARRCQYALEMLADHVEVVLATLPADTTMDDVLSAYHEAYQCVIADANASYIVIFNHVLKGKQQK